MNLLGGVPKSNVAANSSAYHALVCLVSFFVVVVTVGWGGILGPVVGTFSIMDVNFSFHRYIVAFPVALAGVYLAKAVADEKIRLAGELEPQFKKTWWAYFGVLLVISALGTMNLLFKVTQENLTIDDAIVTTEKHLQKLRFSIDKELATPNFDRQTAEIRILFNNVEKEARNPANCGFGRQTMQHLNALRAKLPKLKILSVSGTGCEKVEETLAQYRDSINLLTRELARDDEKERVELRQKAAADLDKKIGELNDFKLNPGLLNKSDALPVLTKAWDLYAEHLTKAELIVGKKFGLEDDIKIITVQNLGQIEHIIPTLLSQYDRISTWVIIILAVFFDAMLVAFFQRHLFAQRPPVSNSPYAASQSGRAVNLLED